MLASGGRAGAADVAVIGGGIIGTTTAALLAAAGARVVLYERADLAAGASGRNSGVIQHPIDPVLVALHLETVALYRALGDALDGAFALPAAPSGLLHVSHDPAVARGIAATLAATHPELRPSFLDVGEPARLEPSVAPDVAACRVEIGYPVAPGAATRAWASLAERRGVRLALGAEAIPRVIGDRVSGVRVDGRDEPAGAVCVAAGPWTPALLDPAGGWRPIRAIWGVVVGLRLAAPPEHVLEEAAIDEEIEPGGAGRADETAAGVAFSLVSADGRSSLGSTFLPAEPDAAALVPTLRRRGALFVPAVADAPLEGVRACARPTALDGRPLVGAVPWLRGAFVAAGHGPWGISTGPATGRMIADLVLGREAALPAALDPARFGLPSAGVRAGERGAFE